MQVAVFLLRAQTFEISLPQPRRWRKMASDR
jgi:hypothetical protein